MVYDLAVHDPVSGFGLIAVLINADATRAVLKAACLRSSPRLLAKHMLAEWLSSLLKMPNGEDEAALPIKS